MLDEQKWAFVAYSGLCTQINTSTWYRIKPGLWKIIRHQLESYGAEELEESCIGKKVLKYNGIPVRNTIVRGFVCYSVQRHYRTDPMKGPLDLLPDNLVTLLKCPSSSNLVLLNETKQELKTSDTLIANSFVLLIRSAMPLGSKPFVPLEETFKFNMLSETMTTRPEVQQDLQKLLDDHSTKFHASDRPMAKYVLRCNRGSTPYLYSVPPLDYLCNSCGQYGKHFSDACFLWPHESKDSYALFGAKKFREAKAVDTTDSTFYKLLHQKHIKK